MVIPSYEAIQQLNGDYNMIPVCKEIFADVITPITLLRKLAQIDRNYYLLESIEGGQRWGRYSFLGFNPLLKVTCKQGVVTVRANGLKTTYKGEPMAVLRQILGQYKSPKFEGLPPFTGGFVGYFAYEMIGYAEPKLNLKVNDVYDFDLMLFDKVIAYDHLKQKISIVVNMKAEDGIQGYNATVLEIDKIIRMIYDTTPLPELKADEDVSFSCNVTKEQYMEMVEKTIHHIYEGDIFQGVISRKFEAEYHGSLLNAYRILRTTNPSPYMYFIQNEDIQIAGASPETMVKLQEGELTTFPVAGTRPRGLTLEEDERLEAELLADAKEVSEHNMLVDLARNDVGRIAEFGSVTVEDYMKIHRFSKVMHIASVVKGKIRPDNDGPDAVTALLPAGTLSGAPKFRACEIINELEPEARGVYGGAIGYIDFSGNLDVCIAIRTAVKKGSKVTVQAGAGIVADSQPEKEYEECGNKASAVMDAIVRAKEVNGL